MLTIESLTAVISLCISCFDLGYTIGRDSKNTHSVIHKMLYFSYKPEFAFPFLLKFAR